MALRVRFQFQTGSSLGFSIERLVDGTFWDFSTTSSTAQTFTATPTTLIQSLPEGTTNFLGSYSYTLPSTPVAQFSNGEYAVRIHNTASSNSVVGILPANMYNGDDTPYYPASIASAVLTDTTSADESVSGSLGYIINHAPSWFSTVTSSGPTAAQIATAVLTDTTSTDLATAGSLGYMIGHSPSWYVVPSTPPTPPTAAQIATAVLTDTTSTDLATAGSLGYMIGHAPTWYNSSGSTLTAAQIATAVWTDTTSSDFSVTGSPGSILSTNLNATVSSRLAASSYVAPTTPPTAAQIATAVLTDTTSTDLATAGSLGYMIGHSPSWYVAPSTPPTPPTVSQIASAVWTDVASTDFGVTGSPGAKLFSIAGSGSTVDPWSVALPGSYATGTAGYIVGHNIDAQVSTRSTYAGGPVQSVVAPVEIDLTEAVPFTNAPNSVGDCLNAARAQGFGKWILSGTTLQLFAPDGVTIVRTFQLDNPDGPTQRI